MKFKNTFFIFTFHPLLLVAFIVCLTTLVFIACTKTPHANQYVDNAHKNIKINENFQEKSTNTPANSLASDFYNLVDIKFREGSAQLTESAKNSLQASIEQSLQNEKLNEIIILSWSDQEYPLSNLKKLPRNQTDLAENRNRSIEIFFKSIKNVRIDTHNMAKRPNLFSRLFNTSDKRIKDSYMKVEFSPRDSDFSKDYTKKASHAVIIINPQ